VHVLVLVLRGAVDHLIDINDDNGDNDAENYDDPDKNDVDWND
jgi:hypothetical protein